MADLGDGKGSRTSFCLINELITNAGLPGNETAVIRYNYGDPNLGSCKESVQGGNHFRYWVQDGSKANRCVLRLVMLV